MTFAMTGNGQYPRKVEICSVLTVKTNNADDETDRENKDDKRVNLESRRLVSVESCVVCQLRTLTMHIYVTG